MKASSLSAQAQARRNGRAGWKLIFASPRRVAQIADKLAEGWQIVDKGK